VDVALRRAFDVYSRSLFAAGAVAACVVGVVSTLHLDVAFWVVVGACALVAVPGAVLDTERSILSLAHLPILAAVFLEPPLVSMLAAAVLAFVGTHRYGSRVWMVNCGGTALAAGASVGVFQGLAPLVGLPTDADKPLWFFAAAAAAAVFFLTNHALIALGIAMKYGDRPTKVWLADLRPMLGGDLIGSVVLIGFVGLMAGVDDVALRVVIAIVALMCVSLLVALILRTREREQALVERERALAEREEALASAERAHRQARAASHLAARAQAQAALANQELEQATIRVHSAVSRLHDVTVGTVPSLVSIIDLKDHYTARHSAAVATLARLLAEELDWSPEEQALAHMTGLVHDIGKVGLPDALLRKPGRPTVTEWHEIRRHPDWGADALAEISLFPSVVDGVRSHHERWDGSGYPRRLAGDDIPPLGRIIAIADSFEAMTTLRPFRGAMGEDAAREELVREAGRLYDPEMVEAFLRALDRVGGHVDPILDFNAEWRRACHGLDLARLYMLEGGSGDPDVAVPSAPGPPADGPLTVSR
jgi:putative nucleotidyltransferase with HDIG domain